MTMHENKSKGIPRQEQYWNCYTYIYFSYARIFSPKTTRLQILINPLLLIIYSIVKFIDALRVVVGNGSLVRAVVKPK